MIHLVCIADGGAPAGASDQSPAEVIVQFADGLVCVGRPCADPVPPTDPPALVEHDRLVQRWMQAGGGVIPFRYGTVVDDVVRLRAELSPRECEFRSLLARLRGRVELALRVAAAPAGAALRPSHLTHCERTGRSYLRSLEAGREPSACRQLHRTLAGFAFDAEVEPDGHGGIKASYLVDRGDVDGFCRLLARTVSRSEGLGPVSLTGPWAPYSFAATNDDRPVVAITGGSLGDPRA